MGLFRVSETNKFNWNIHVHLIMLRMSTGRRRTSGLFISMADNYLLSSWDYREQIQHPGRVGLKNSEPQDYKTTP